MIIVAHSADLLFLLVKLLPLGTEEFAYFAWRNGQEKSAYICMGAIPKPASGFSVLILSLQSWLKNMYADRARLGALGSFLALRGAFSAF